MNIVQYKVVFKPTRLLECINSLSTEFFLPEEFPMRTLSEEISLLISDAAYIPANDLEKYAFILNSKELEQILLYLPVAKEDELNAIEIIFKKRANRRILKLYWALFQYNFDNISVKKIGLIILDSLYNTNESKDIIYRNLSYAVLDKGIDKICGILKTQNCLVSSFLVDNNLILESPFTIKVLEALFSSCTKESFLLNEKFLLYTLKTTSLENLHKILNCYLDILDEREYLLSINTYIYERLGWPYISDNWSYIHKNLQDKFVRWDYIRKLNIHITKNKNKLNVLTEYYKHFKNVYLSNDNQIIVIDFGEFSLVDDNELSNYSYIVKDSTYKKLCKTIEDLGFDIIKFQKKYILSARDFIIDENEENIMLLDYNNIGRLYIKEMLDINLGIVKDLRKSKTLLNRKEISKFKSNRL